MIGILEITSLQNPLIKDIRSLDRKKDRWEKQLFIIEGIKLIQEALASGLDLKYILYSEKLLTTNEGTKFYEDIKDEENLLKVSNQVFREISNTESPQGVIGVGKFDIREIEEITKNEKSLFIYLDGIQDPGNMGTIIRSGDAFNIGGIILGGGCVDPYNPKVVRSTMGSIFRLPLYFCNNSLEFINKMRKSNFNIISSDLDGNPLSKELLREKSIVIIGNEARGVDKDLLQISNIRVRIPMPGKAESLNAGVAASIIMYEAMQARNLEL